MRKTLSLLLSAFLFVFAFIFGSCTKKEDIALGNVVILGDSYSTFENYIPDGYSCWYYPTASYTDVHSVKETWWHQLIHSTHSQLMLNSSYSGSTICNTGYDNADVSSSSFVGRITELLNKTDFEKEKVDTLIIYGGLNDYWANAPFGEFIYENWTKEDLYCIYPAFTYLLSTAKQGLPNARIVVIIEELLSEKMKENLAFLCQQLDVEYIQPKNISKKNSHPDLLGMDQLTEQIIEYFKQTP